jgi:hypothetical protein
MHFHRLSRRQLLGGLLSGLLGGGWSGTGRGRTPNAAPRPQGPVPEPLGPRTITYIYEAGGRFFSAQDTLLTSATPLVYRWSYDAGGQGNSCTDAG